MGPWRLSVMVEGENTENHDLLWCHVSLGGVGGKDCGYGMSSGPADGVIVVVVMVMMVTLRDKV